MKRTWIAGVVAALVMIGILIVSALGSSVDEETGEPSVTLMSPPPAVKSEKEEIIIDVVVSNLPDEIFPAASLSVEFPTDKLEFANVKAGTMMITNTVAQESVEYQIPSWEYDVPAANELGIVNTMYLDMTGGQCAYTRDGFIKGEKDILISLIFKLKEEAQAGDIYNVNIKDAVFATIDDEDTGLATNNNTLKAYPAKIMVKEGA